MYPLYLIFMAQQSPSHSVDDSNQVSSAKRTRRHRLSGTLLEKALTLLENNVLIEVRVISDPPQADIVLLRRNMSFWTEE
ncbi:hypothetical protein KFU94_17260 [Chloroflexi bacterium TSY]|nr:hypothetical protein [Chloroflexi bacterium TSY]